MLLVGSFHEKDETRFLHSCLKQGYMCLGLDPGCIT